MKATGHSVDGFSRMDPVASASFVYSFLAQVLCNVAPMQVRKTCLLSSNWVVLGNPGASIFEKRSETDAPTSNNKKL
jgi:hypothetical protein